MGLFDRILKRLRGEPEPVRQDAPGLFTARSPGVSTEPSGTTEESVPPEDLWDRPDPTPTAEAAEAAGAVDAVDAELVEPVEPDVTEPVVLEPGVLEPEDVAPEDEPAQPVDPAAELAAIEELAPPVAEPETPVAPVWDEAAWVEAGETTELAQQGADEPEERTVEDGDLDDMVAPAGSTADEPLFSDRRTAPEPPASEEPAPDPVPPLFDPPEVVTEPEPEAVAPDVAAYIDAGPEAPAPELAAEPTPEPEPRLPEPGPVTPEPEPITPDPEPEPVTPDPEPEPVTPEPGPAPEPEAEPRGLVVETHPEVFETAPVRPPADAPAPAAAPGEPAAGEEPTTAADRTVRVHDERLDKRPGPIRMTPSEAIRLAQDGPRVTRRPGNPEV